MLIGTGRGQQKRGIVARFLVPTCIVMNKNVFMGMHWIALNVFKLVLALQKLIQNNYHRRKAKNRIFTKSTETVTVTVLTMTCDQSNISTSELAAGAGITAQERLAA